MLDKKEPREQSGRDSFSRYRAQVRSAAMATLSILEGKEIDRVYCDLHDDFVIRKNDSSGLTYVFYQVKTNGKQNHNWTLSEIFGINSKLKADKQNTNKIKNSFIGKMLLHTVVFNEYCEAVVFQTNIHNHDGVIKLLDDIKSNKMSDKFTKVLIERFNDCYKDVLPTSLSDDEIKENISKLRFETDVQYLKQNDNSFEPLAGEKIFEYSEIELSKIELQEILLKLLDLVANKSSGIIPSLDEKSIEALAGISIDDLLSILSISKDAYETLIKGGDSKAIKSASIIQRSLLNANASDEVVEYASRCKINWDVWIRNNRHVIPELTLISITQHVKALLNDLIDNNTILIEKLQTPIEDLLTRLTNEEINYDLDTELILGGIFAELVREKS